MGSELETKSKGAIFKETDNGRRRFLLELEFLQLLANPTYIHYLAQNRYFENPAFVKYLDYLQYWKRPEYVKFIMYPHSLFFLDLLQNANFRTAMAHPANKEIAHRQQFYFWQHYRNNRLKLLQEQGRRSMPETTDTEDKLKTEVPSTKPLPTDAVTVVPKEEGPEKKTKESREGTSRKRKL